MEMQQIRYFLAVTDTLNFTHAAEQCNVSQPALTRAIKALEEELGAPLINREQRNTHLTELGRLMDPYFRTIFEQSMSAKSAPNAFAALGKASLKIGAMCTIGPSIVAEFVARFAGKNVLPCRELDGEPYINRSNCEYFDVVSAAFAAQGIKMRRTFSSE